MKYEIPIIYRGQVNFIVEAESPEKALEIATQRFNNGDTPDVLGNEWEQIEMVKKPVGDLLPIQCDEAQRWYEQSDLSGMSNQTLMGFRLKMQMDGKAALM